ncbi:hypothetical protein ACXR2W_11555 [Leucobacter sp. HY1908]
MGIGFIPNGEPFGSDAVRDEAEIKEIDFAKIWQHELERDSNASREASAEYFRFLHSK